MRRRAVSMYNTLKELVAAIGEGLALLVLGGIVLFMWRVSRK